MASTPPSGVPLRFLRQAAQSVPRYARTFVRRLIICALAGAASTALLSVLLALITTNNRWAQPSSFHWGYTGDPPEWLANTYRLRGAVRYEYRPWASMNVVGVEPEPVSPPNWAAPPPGPTAADLATTLLIEDRIAYGWPLPAMTYEIRGQRNDTSARQYIILAYRYAIPFQRSGPNDLRAIPLRPIWSGFAVNSILTCSLFFVLWQSITSARRLRRIRTARCPACGYVLSGGTCPECGTPSADDRAA